MMYGSDKHVHAPRGILWCHTLCSPPGHISLGSGRWKTHENQKHQCWMRAYQKEQIKFSFHSRHFVISEVEVRLTGACDCIC